MVGKNLKGLVVILTVAFSCAAGAAATDGKLKLKNGKTISGQRVWRGDDGNYYVLQVFQPSEVAGIVGDVGKPPPSGPSSAKKGRVFNNQNLEEFADYSRSNVYTNKPGKGPPRDIETFTVERTYRQGDAAFVIVRYTNSSQRNFELVRVECDFVDQNGKIVGTGSKMILSATHGLISPGREITEKIVTLLHGAEFESVKCRVSEVQSID